MRRVPYKPAAYVVFKPGAAGEAGNVVATFTKYANAERAALKAGGAQVWAKHRSGAQNTTTLVARTARGDDTFTFNVRELVAYPKPAK